MGPSNSTGSELNSPFFHTRLLHSLYQRMTPPSTQLLELVIFKSFLSTTANQPMNSVHLLFFFLSHNPFPSMSRVLIRPSPLQALPRLARTGCLMTRHATLGSSLPSTFSNYRSEHSPFSSTTFTRCPEPLRQNPKCNTQSTSPPFLLGSPQLNSYTFQLHQTIHSFALTPLCFYTYCSVKNAFSSHPNLSHICL